mgnify:CR=1 FL=1
MHISKVSLVNYRNFENSVFLFNKGINTIIGENGSGKTNLFKAIRLLLEDSSISYSYKLDETDFNRSIGNWKGQWIIISIEFDELSQDEAIQALFIHGAGNIQGGNTVSKATYNLFFRPKAHIRKKLSELAVGDSASLNTLLNSISIQDDYETYFTGKSTVDFNDPEIYKELVGDFQSVEFKFEFDESKFGVKIPHQLSVSKEICFTFIKALRDVVSDFHNNKTNPLITLLKNKSGEIKDTDYAPIKQMIIDLNESIETLPDIQNISSDIKDTIKDAVGETYSPSSLSIKSSLSDEAEKLLQSLRLYIGEPNESHEGGIHELSLGGANLIYLTLKLLEYKYQKSKKSFANFLLIEEPEAHIHTHIQKTLFDKIDSSDTQIIYSTHSTHISEVSNIVNMNILSKQEDYAEVYQPSNGLTVEETTHIQRYLDAKRSNLLFAKGVLLVEGDAEEIIIPYLIKKVLGVSLDELGISLINIGSTGFENVAQLFHDDRIQRNCAIITDLDEAIDDITPLQTDSEDVKKYKSAMEKSRKSGKERQERLNNFTVANDWLDVFFADYTFEVDFLKAGNQDEVKRTLPVIYSRQTKIDEMTLELDSDQVAVFGKAVLKLANNKGKGWFAILLTNYISFNTTIPNYIVDAIHFIKEDFSNNILSEILLYRLKEYKKDIANQYNFVDCERVIKDFKNEAADINAIITELQKVIPNDQIIYFLQQI